MVDGQGKTSFPLGVVVGRKYRFCTIVRTIVDDQNFDVGVRLVEKGLQTPFNPMSAVTHTYGNGDLGPRH